MSIYSMTDAIQSSSAPCLRVALLTTPSGLDTCRHLVRHLNVAGILIDYGPWGRRPQAWMGRMRRGLRHGFDLLRKPSPFAWSGLGVPVAWTVNVNSEHAQRILRRWSCDLGIIVGGRIVKRSTFAIPRLGTINKHSSLLPRHRGLAAEYWCLYHEDLDALGVTVHFVDDGCDSGPILLQRPMILGRGDTPGSLRQRSEELGREAIVEAVRLIEQTGTRGITQNETLATVNGKPTLQTDQELARRLPELWSKYAA